MAEQGSPHHGPGLTWVLTRNIRALSERRRREETDLTAEERVVTAITGFAGSMYFVYLHLLFFGLWIIANLGWVPGVRPWDASFTILAVLGSIEAIFLTVFVLISQNRMSALADKRADLDVQINLLSEHEITKVAALLEAIARHLDVEIEAEEEISEVKKDVAPEAVLDAIEAAAPSGQPPSR